LDAGPARLLWSDSCCARRARRQIRYTAIASDGNAGRDDHGAPIPTKSGPCKCGSEPGPQCTCQPGTRADVLWMFADSSTGIVEIRGRVRLTQRSGCLSPREPRSRVKSTCLALTLQEPTLHVCETWLRTCLRVQRGRVPRGLPEKAASELWSSKA
jgi:hypothetical protein